MQPAVFLDRDNTLILNDGDLGRAEDVRLMDGVAEGLRLLREAGFHLIVVTNQAGVARGVFTEDDVDAVHQRIAALVDEGAHESGLIERFYYCPYHPEGKVKEYCRDHTWRKPNPGMILQAASDVGVDLSRSWMIGDQERDVQAGRAAGCRTILVTKDEQLIGRVSPTAAAADFLEAVHIILEHAHLPDAVHPGHSNGAPAERSTNPTTAPNPQPSDRNEPDLHSEFTALRRTMTELAEEIRSDRLRRAEFTLVRMLAGLCQLLALLLALLALLQLSNTEVFIKWMLGAALAQLVTITLLALDLKG